MSRWWQEFCERENKRRLDEMKREIERLRTELMRKGTELQVENCSESYKPYVGKCPEDCK
jgi:hypothetical protein